MSKKPGGKDAKRFSFALFSVLKQMEQFYLLGSVEY